MLTSSRVTLASLTTVCFSTAVGLADPTRIALSGTAAPGSDATYSTFGNPVLNAAGQVAFTAALTGGTPTSGLFAGAPGAVQAVALQGTTAPNGGTYGNLTSPPTLNGSGQLGFLAPVGGGTATPAVLTGTAAAVQTVAVQGTAAPAGGNYNVFAATGAGAASSPVVNGSGQVAFQSTLTGGTSAAGVFLSTAGTTQAVALVGQAAPPPTGGTASIGNYTTTFANVVLNGSGQVSFVSLIGTTQGLFAGSPGALQTAAYGAAPGGVGNYGSFTSTSYNNAGQVAFSSSLTGGTSTNGVFAGTPGAVQAVALQGSAVPGAASNTFSTFANVNINGAGNVAFGANFTGISGTSGLFQAKSGTVQPVAILGGTAPDNETYASFASALVQNGVGQVAFVANLSGADVTTGTNSVALFAGLPGALTEIVRQGQTIDVDPGPGVDLRTISGSISLIINGGGQDGRGVAFNDSGLLTYKLSFTDGSTGIFTSAVPEPAALSLAALAGVGLLRRRTPAK